MIQETLLMINPSLKLIYLNLSKLIRFKCQNEVGVTSERIIGNNFCISEEVLDSFEEADSKLSEEEIIEKREMNKHNY